MQYHWQTESFERLDNRALYRALQLRQTATTANCSPTSAACLPD